MQKNLLYHLLHIILVITVLKEVNGRGKSNSNARQIVREPAKSRTITINDRSYTYTYSNKSFRNYNSGARYYMRNKMETSTIETFGYSFYSGASYYYSGYGYRMYNPPSDYYPVYVGTLFYYFSPMFHRFYRSNVRYWDGNRPRYVCRNQNAFWPLENQTSEFVDGRVPALDLRQFDEYLPDPADEQRFAVPTSSFDVTVSDENFTELNSYSANKALLQEYDNFGGDVGDFLPLSVAISTVEPLTSDVIPLNQSPNSPYTRREILAYEYFACPDGKDPEEIECCGPADAQYCCITVASEAWIYILIGLAIFSALIILLVRTTVQKCRQRKANRNRSQPIQQFTTTAVQYVPAANESGVRIYVPSNPITTTAYQYQEVQVVSNPMTF